jgi:TolB-like protein
MNFILVILIVGFIITVIVSWVYDIHPEGGIAKTEPANKVKKEDKPVTSKSWRIASYISFVVIVGLIVLNIIPRIKGSDRHRNLEKSIAVLPLEYLSENPDKAYLADGVLDAITGHLSLIKGLRVMPRTSVEQYRENRKTAKEIGEELDVSYLVEGSFLMVENRVKLTIQLVVAKEDYRSRCGSKIQGRA